MDCEKRGAGLGYRVDLNLSALHQTLDQPSSLAPLHDAPSPAGFRDAAVIVPLVMRQGHAHLIFNKRAANLENHAGQVSFPGGRRDPQDQNLLNTAQRELEEELGIPADLHRPLRRLPPRLVISHYQVTPFVSLIEPNAEIIADPGEVAYAFEVPLGHFMQPGTEVDAQRNVFGQPRIFYTWNYGGETIWGATGRIIADLLIVLGASHIKP